MVPQTDAPIRIIITGGTFDKQYDPLRGELTFNRTHLPEILSAVGCRVPTELEISQLIDSLDMVEHHRDRIVDSCRAAAEDRIVITHGTDTMTVTADRLVEARLPKTIVLTGAMVPYAVNGSDAVFNLGAAIAAVQLLPAGVYITMHGQVFAAQAVRKNRAAGFFERT